MAVLIHHSEEDVNDLNNIPSSEVPSGKVSHGILHFGPERNSHNILAALLLLLPLALAFTHPPPMLGHFHTPPLPFLPPPTHLHPPFLLRRLPACVLSFLFSLRCCYSNGEMWEYLRPSECRGRKRRRERGRGRGRGRETDIEREGGRLKKRQEDGREGTDVWKRLLIKRRGASGCDSLPERTPHLAPPLSPPTLSIRPPSSTAQLPSH